MPIKVGNQYYQILVYKKQPKGQVREGVMPIWEEMEIDFPELLCCDIIIFTIKKKMYCKERVRITKCYATKYNSHDKWQMAAKD